MSTIRSIHLASQSPRRLELLRQIGWHPVVLPLRQTGTRADVDETALAGETAIDYVQRIARMKALAGLKAVAGRHLPAWPILAADTTVSLDGRILGKPADAEEAAAMLRAFSGKTHSVLTAVALAWQEQVTLALSVSTVRFRALTEAEIAAYIVSREPFDKAGGYAIQGRAALFVEHLQGSYSGVMGLPLYETGELLRQAGFSVL